MNSRSGIDACKNDALERQNLTRWSYTVQSLNQKRLYLYLV